MNTLHLVLHAKGGIGKTLVSSLLIDWLNAKGKLVQGIDIDSANSADGSLKKYKDIPIKRVDVLDGFGNVDQSKIDPIIAELLEGNDISIVVDAGASTSYSSVCNYLLESSIIDVLKESGTEVYMHTVILGGDLLEGTMETFAWLADQFGNSAKLVAWLNERDGKIERDGKSFADFKAVKAREQAIVATIVLAQRNPATFGKDLKMARDHGLSLSGAIADPAFSIVTKQRLKTIRSGVFEQLDALLLPPAPRAKAKKETAA